MFCSYSFEEKIEKYQWKNVNEVGEEFVGAFGGPLVDMDGELDTGRAPESICEEFLGGIWTGNHCCGNKYAYPSNGYIDEYFSDPSPADQFPANHACIAAEAVQSGQQREIESTVTTNEDGDFVQNSFLSADGVVYGCNLETDDIPNEYFLPNGDVPSNGLPSEDKIQNADACAVVYSNLEFSGGGFAFVCDSIANTWLNTGDPIVQTERNADLSIENIHTSYSWDDPSQLSPACCFDNGCFDGEQGVCVPQHETKILNSGEANEEVYSCLAGSWGNPLDEDYDWFYNTNIEDESRTFCAEPFSCSCSTTSADDTYCGDDAVDDAIVRVDGCTMESNYFINDHYCEPGTVSGQWTSRTKLLAIQLMQMAGTNEYTLFCDDHANALNDQTMTDYLVADDINNLCVLRYNDGQEHVVLGTTFNGDSDEALTTELEEGLFGSGGFIQAVGADIDDTECLDALTIHGTIPADFQPCASASELWINAELGAAIYSAEGPLTLPTLNVAAGNDDLQDFYDEITTHLNDNIDAVEDEILEPEVFNNILEFNTVYLQETSATEYTFGVEEIRHVIRHVPGMDENRYFTAIVYAGTTLNCDLVEEAYILQSLNGAGAVYCGTDGSNSFIFERSSSGSIFWKDLGAKLRW